jgi:hypothetical protein
MPASSRRGVETCRNRAANYLLVPGRMVAHMDKNRLLRIDGTRYRNAQYDSLGMCDGEDRGEEGA